jgi:hypothetical protein
VRAAVLGWTVLAAAGVGLAVFYRGQGSIALLLATAGCGAALVAVADALRTAHRAPGRRTVPGEDLGPSARRRLSGEMYREELVLRLDRLERCTVRPGLPARTGQDIGELVELPLPDFRQYVAARLDAIERFR